MRCQCILTPQPNRPGKCLHPKVGKCNMKTKKEFKAPGARLQLCNGCAKQYSMRWHSGHGKTAA